MKKLALLLLLTTLLASLSLAKTQEGETAMVIGMSQSSVSGPLVRAATTVHFTVETETMVFFLDYSYHPEAKAPAPGKYNKNSPPDLSVNAVTKILVSGKSAYIYDNAGRKVKMHITKKTKK